MVVVINGVGSILVEDGHTYAILLAIAQMEYGVGHAPVQNRKYMTAPTDFIRLTLSRPSFHASSYNPLPVCPIHKILDPSIAAQWRDTLHTKSSPNTLCPAQRGQVILT